MANQVAAIPSPETPVLKSGGGMSDVWWRFICVTLLQRTGGAAGVDVSALQKQVTELAGELTSLDAEFHSASPLAAMIIALFDRVVWLESNSAAPIPLSLNGDETPAAVPMQQPLEDVPVPVTLPSVGSDALVPVPYLGNSLAVRQDGSLGSNVSLGTGAASSTATLTNAPVSGNPSKWVPVDDQGTTRYLPLW